MIPVKNKNVLPGSKAVFIKPKRPDLNWKTK